MNVCVFSDDSEDLTRREISLKEYHSVGTWGMQWTLVQSYCNRPTLSRGPVHVWVRLAFAGTVTATIGWLLRDYFVLRLGRYGYEWSERYGTIVSCHGTSMLLTRMRHIGYGKYVPVLRQNNSRCAFVLWNMTLLGFNPTIYCDNGSIFLMGSMSTEWPPTVTGAPHVVYKAMIHPTMGQIENANFNMSSCIDKVFPSCSLDGKFSVTLRDHTWFAFIRANMFAEGGGRFVQMATRDKKATHWSPFQAIQMEGVRVARHTNIYTFDVSSMNPNLFVARFPATFGEKGGVYESFSHDGVRWSPPVMLIASKVYGQRTMLHPVGLNHLMDINLHLNTQSVRLRRIIERSNKRVRSRRDDTFYTDFLVDI